MTPVLSAQAMREADQATIEKLGIPGFTLMETAGRAAVDAIQGRLEPSDLRHVVCLCGKGNNGGDGFVVARVLHARGYQVSVVLLHAPEASTPDSLAHYTVLKQLQDDRLRILRWEPQLPAMLSNASCWVDAMLGIGIGGKLREPYRTLVDFLNEHPAPVVALDIPTGLHADEGRALGACVRAKMTVAMGASKPGLLLSEAAGEIIVAEIGIPDAFMTERANAAGSAWSVDDTDVASWLPGRDRSTHKYKAGLVVAVVGSEGLTGAGAMAARAAARIGAGAVVAATPASAEPALAAKLTNVMTLPLPEGDDGVNTDAALEALGPPLEKAKAVLIGCGLGRAPETQAFVRALLAQIDVPAVVDADALRALAGRIDFIKEHAKGRWILTPHLGEFRELTNVEDPGPNRLKAARKWAEALDAVLVMKGLPSTVGTPAGPVFINATGNPALATAGTGDVLAGLCAGLLAQGVAPSYAAVGGLHIGGAAADDYIASASERSMQATDLIERLPSLLKQRFF